MEKLENADQHVAGIGDLETRSGISPKEYLTATSVYALITLAAIPTGIAASHLLIKYHEPIFNLWNKLP